MQLFSLGYDRDNTYCMTKLNPETAALIGITCTNRRGYLVYRTDDGARPAKQGVIISVDSEAAAYEYPTC